MNKIVGIFRNQRQADRVVEALNEMGIDKDALHAFSRPRVEVDDLDNKSAEEVMVTAHVRDANLDEVETVFKNSEAEQVNVWEKDWEPETTWSPIIYGRTSNS